MIFSCFMASSMVGSAIAGRVLGSSRCHTDFSSVSLYPSHFSSNGMQGSLSVSAAPADDITQPQLCSLPDEQAGVGAAPQKLLGDSALAAARRFKPEKYMQLVFAVSAAALFIPVLYHRTRNEETDSLNKDSPGAGSLAAGRSGSSTVPAPVLAYFHVVFTDAAQLLLMLCALIYANYWLCGCCGTLTAGAAC